MKEVLTALAKNGARGVPSWARTFRAGAVAALCLSATAALAGADIKNPVVAIKAPTAALRILGTNGTYVVSGTASDNLAVTAVNCQLNDGLWATATGTKTWSRSVTLTPGANTVRAFSVDAAGNHSKTSSVSCTYAVTGRLTVNVSGSGTVKRAPTGEPEVGKAYTLTAAPGTGFGFKSWMDGDSQVLGTNKVLAFTMTSNAVFTAKFADVVKPTVVIKTPTAALRVTNEVYTVTGTAADNKGVTAVKCLVNGEGWTNASGTSAWGLPVTLIPGTNTIWAFSVDAEGNNSKTSSVVCSYVVYGKLKVYTNGLGTVVCTPKGALEVNKAYTLTATPGLGWGFISWADGEGAVVSTNRALSFIMTTNRVFAANFKDFFEEGQAALSRFADTNSTPQFDAQLIAVAATNFDAATKSAPLNYTNRIYNAVTIMLNLLNDPVLRGQAEAYGVSLDDLFNPSCVYPTNAPAVDASVDKLAASVLPAVDKAWAELNAIPSTWTGRIEISPDQYPVDEAVWVDAGDVAGVKAALKGLRAFVGLLKAYSLNTDYERIADPIVTPRAAITVDGLVGDWADVPPAQMIVNYPGEGDSYLTFTQEMAVALSGTNIALVVTECPFTIGDSAYVSFDIRLCDGDAFVDCRSQCVNIWIEGSSICGEINDQPINGLEAQLSGDGVLELKFPDQEGLTVSQVILEEVYCEMDVGEGYWEEMFSSREYTDSPMQTLLDSQPELFSKVRDTASLANVKADLKSALNGYLAADTLIAKRTGVNAALLHFIDFNPSDEGATEDRLEKKDLVSKVLASLTSPVQMKGDESIEGKATRPVFLGGFFNAPYITTNMLPWGLKGTLNNPSWDAFPDPTFHGMLPGMTNANLNKYLLGYTEGNVNTAYNSGSGACQLRFGTGTDRRHMVITNVTVSGAGVSAVNLNRWRENDWGYHCDVSSKIAAGTRYAFTVEFADGSQETVYGAIKSWLTFKSALSGSVIKWAAMSNADHYVVSVNGHYLELSSDETSFDLSTLGLEAGKKYSVWVGGYNKNGDCAYNILTYAP